MERLQRHVFEESGIGPDPLMGYLDDDVPVVVAARAGVQREPVGYEEVAATEVRLPAAS